MGISAVAAETIATITSKAFFDIEIGGKQAGRLVFGLFGNEAPKTVKNFETISLGVVNNNKKMSYTGTKFHRVIPGFMAQGGDFELGNGRGGSSIYGKTFPDENLGAFKFEKPYLLAMANAGPDTNGSQFFITFKPTTWLNGKHQIFGQLMEGEDVLKQMEAVGSSSGDTSSAVKILWAGIFV